MDENDIVRSAQLAAALEIVYPKPGNVHRASDFKEETFEQFIAGSIVIGPSLNEAVEKGLKVGRGEITASEVKVGRLVKSGVESTKDWTEENTNLGVLLLLIPLTAAAGMTFGEESKIEGKPLRKNLSTILKSTTPQDALSVYDAIQAAGPGGLGDTDELSVEEDNSRERIIEDNISLYEIMDISSDWDTISKEWVTDMKITFEEGFPSIKEIYEEEKDMNSAVVQTYLKLLSNHPDTHILREYGEETADNISKRAKNVLEKGGIFSERGREAVEKMDIDLKDRDVNPGTTADLIASSLMLVFLDCSRPVFNYI